MTKEEANLFKILGDINRLKIIKILTNTGKEVCACNFFKMCRLWSINIIISSSSTIRL